MRLQAKQLSLARNGQSLFRNLNIEISMGELILIAGPNGSGKSSLLKILAGLLDPDKGHITWQGKQQDETLYEQLSYMGHKDGLHKTLTPIENMIYQHQLANVMFSNQRSQEVLCQLGLADIGQRLCQNLSAGQKRKVALACIFLMNKPLWILDEPFTTLDVPSINICETFFKQHLAKGGMIFLASHFPLETIQHRIIDFACKESSC